MAKGGKREGAGRPVGAISRKSREMAEKAASEGITPLEFMLNVLRDETMTFDSRCWAAEKAAPYIHAKLSSVEVSGDSDNPIVTEIVIRGVSSNSRSS
jgi:hypothetical protein